LSASSRQRAASQVRTHAGSTQLGSASPRARPAQPQPARPAEQTPQSGLLVYTRAAIPLGVAPKLPPARSCPGTRTHADRFRAPCPPADVCREPQPTCVWSEAPLAAVRKCGLGRNTKLKSFHFNNFKSFLTLFSKFFSSFLHSTCSLSVSRRYLALDEIYHPIKAVLPNNLTLRSHYVSKGLVAPLFTGLSPSLTLRSGRL